MEKALLEKFSVFRKQSAIGSIVLFANAVRKNAYNFYFQSHFEEKFNILNNLNN